MLDEIERIRDERAKAIKDGQAIQTAKQETPFPESIESERKKRAELLLSNKDLFDRVVKVRDSGQGMLSDIFREAGDIISAIGVNAATAAAAPGYYIGAKAGSPGMSWEESVKAAENDPFFQPAARYKKSQPGSSAVGEVLGESADLYALSAVPGLVASIARAPKVAKAADAVMFGSSGGMLSGALANQIQKRAPMMTKFSEEVIKSPRARSALLKTVSALEKAGDVLKAYSTSEKLLPLLLKGATGGMLTGAIEESLTPFVADARLELPSDEEYIAGGITGSAFGGLEGIADRASKSFPFFYHLTSKDGKKVAGELSRSLNKENLKAFKDLINNLSRKQGVSPEVLLNYIQSHGLTSLLDPKNISTPFDRSVAETLTAASTASAGGQRAVSEAIERYRKPYDDSLEVLAKKTNIQTPSNLRQNKSLARELDTSIQGVVVSTATDLLTDVARRGMSMPLDEFEKQLTRQFVRSGSSEKDAAADAARFILEARNSGSLSLSSTPRESEVLSAEDLATISLDPGAVSSDYFSRDPRWQDINFVSATATGMPDTLEASRRLTNTANALGTFHAPSVDVLSDTAAMSDELKRLTEGIDIPEGHTPFTTEDVRDELRREYLYKEAARVSRDKRKPVHISEAQETILKDLFPDVYDVLRDWNITTSLQKLSRDDLSLPSTPRDSAIEKAGYSPGALAAGLLQESTRVKPESTAEVASLLLTNPSSKTLKVLDDISSDVNWIRRLIPVDALLMYHGLDSKESSQAKKSRKDKEER